MAIDKLGTPAGNANTVTFQEQLDKVNEIIDSVNNVTSGNFVSNTINAREKLVLGGQTIANNETIWTSDNDGSGSGLDADKLDGIESTAFLQKSLPDIQVVSSNVNFTSAQYKVVLPGAAVGTTTGQANTLIINNPVANDAFLSFSITGDFTINFGLDGTTNDLFVGGMSMGANKYKIWHQNNDGTGSGLDADKLDGIEGANFARSDVTDSVHSFTFTDSTGNWSTSNYKATIKIDEDGAGVLWTTSGQNNSFYIGRAGNDLIVAKALVDNAAGAASRLLTFMGAAGVAHFSVTPLANGNPIWHAGNDGSGSGLDADKLDGVEYSAIASAIAAKQDDLGLTGIATKEQAEAGEDNSKAMTPLRVAEAIAALGGDAVDIQVFDASGTWTKPSKGTIAFVEVWGGGGSGAKRTIASVSGGGGGGGYNAKWIPLSSLGATETVTVGAGGAAVTASEANGNDGGSSSFGSHVTAYGGLRGSFTQSNGGGSGGGPLGAPTSANSPGAPFMSFGDRLLGSGGFTPQGGDTFPPVAGIFHGGGGGYSFQAGESSVYGGGGGGGADNGAGGWSLFGGAGGNGSRTGPGQPGAVPGGGGGATEDGASSGAGAHGRVRVIVF